MADDRRWTRVQQWAAVRTAFAAAEALFEEAARLCAACEQEASPDGPPPLPAGYARRRAAVREALAGGLAPVLAEHLGSRQAHAGMMAVSACVDERERVALGPLAEAWRLPSFQRELAGIEDGGDRFFTQLLELMERADVHELLLALHLLCLRSGFVGRYADRRFELELLTDRLALRLAAAAPGPPPAPERAAPGPAPRRVSFVAFPLRYYGWALALVAACYLGLRLVSAHEVNASTVATYCRASGTGHVEEP